MYVGQLFSFVCEELYSVGHGRTVWLLQVNTLAGCELEEQRVKSWRWNSVMTSVINIISNSVFSIVLFHL